MHLSVYTIYRHHYSLFHTISSFKHSDTQTLLHDERKNQITSNLIQFKNSLLYYFIQLCNLHQWLQNWITFQSELLKRADRCTSGLQQPLHTLTLPLFYYLCEIQYLLTFQTWTRLHPWATSLTLNPVVSSCDWWPWKSTSWSFRWSDPSVPKKYLHYFFLSGLHRYADSKCTLDNEHEPWRLLRNGRQPRVSLRILKLSCLIKLAV